QYNQGGAIAPFEPRNSERRIHSGASEWGVAEGVYGARVRTQGGGRLRPRRRGPVAAAPARDGGGQAGPPAPAAALLLRGPHPRGGARDPPHAPLRPQRVPPRGSQGIAAPAPVPALRALRGPPARLLPGAAARRGGRAPAHRGQRRLSLSV